MRIVPGSNRYSIKANWKLLVENSLDGYHVRPTHKTYFEYVNSLGINTSGVQTAFSRPALVLGNGHAIGEGSSVSRIRLRCQRALLTFSCREVAFFDEPPSG